MKKQLLMAIASMVAILAFAQGTGKRVRVYEGNKVVFEKNYSAVDSIVFVDVPTSPEGALSGEFSVSATRKVYFSHGNLQASTTDFGEHWTWGFATNQWDYIGNATANTSINGNGTVSSNGTVDLYGWSTTATFYGINNSTITNTYSGNFKDWGETIGDGWRTLSKDEWVYLFYGRADAKKLFGMGTVNGIKGAIILPDNWAGEKFKDTENGLADQGTFFYNSANTNFSFHTYTIEQWAVMESAGAVFLPVPGRRYGAGVGFVGDHANYWSSTVYNTQLAYNLSFTREKLSPEDASNRYYGRSVRLVREVQQ